MNDDMEQRLGQLTGRGVAPELRSRVLGVVAAELHAAKEKVEISPPCIGKDTEPFCVRAPVSVLSSARRAHRLMLAVAALLLIGVGLNLWINLTLNRRLAAAFGPPPVRKLAAEIASDVASVTDRRTGEWAYQRLAEGQPTGHAAGEYAARLEQAIRQLTVTVEIKETAHEATQKNSHMDGHHHRRGDRHPADPQRLVRMEHRNTAGEATRGVT